MRNQLSLKRVLLDGTLLSVLLSSVLYGAIYANPMLMVHDYPPDIQAAVGPVSLPLSQTIIVGALFFAVVIGVTLCSNASLRQQNGGKLSFPAAFIHTASLLFFFALWDLLILDWLIFVTIQPRFVVIPGTEGLAGYKDYFFHFQVSFLGWTQWVSILVGALIVASLSMIIRWNRKAPGIFFYPLATGPVTQNVYAVKTGNANMFIYTDDEHAIAIDAGYPGSALRQALKRIPMDPGAVTHLFLTHGDVDHTGGLGLFPNAQIYLSQDEEQMINSTTARMLWVYHSPKIDRPHTLLADGDVITVGTIKVRAMATPGHTPGSMSYLVNNSVLFTGDTLTLRKGQVRTFYRLINMDIATQKKSIRKLARLQDIALLCTAHTGCTTNYALAVKHWLEKGEEMEGRA